VPTKNSKKCTPKTQRSRKDTAEKLPHQQDTPHAVASSSKSKNHRQQNNKTPKRTRNTQRTKPPKRHPHYAGNQKRHPQEGKTCHLDTTADKRLTTPTKENSDTNQNHSIAKEDRKRKTPLQEVVQEATQKLEKLIQRQKYSSTT
jgi:hypothetical protein